jgi:hypothetical protein
MCPLSVVALYIQVKTICFILFLAWWSWFHFVPCVMELVSLCSLRDGVGFIMFLAWWSWFHYVPCVMELVSLCSLCRMIKDANNIFNSISSSGVCNEVIRSEQGTEYVQGKGTIKCLTLSRIVILWCKGYNINTSFFF